MSPLERHLEFRYHQGFCGRATHIGLGRNSICGDELRLSLRVSDWSIIQAAYFEPRGCLVSQAAASYLCELIEGKDLSAAAAITDETFLKLLGMSLTPTRRFCALLSLQTLRRLIRQPTPPVGE